MLFNSVHFLLFFPVVTLIYFIVPQRVKWVWLLGASYYFYMCWNPQYALLIATSTLITYASGRLISYSNTLKDQQKAKKQKKLWVFLSFSSNLLILFFFKYFNFFIDNLNVLLEQVGLSLVQPTFDVMLPVGISFYTFQALSYTMDVYRQDIEAERNLGKYALFVSFFPQLVAGPIERSKNLLTQIHETHKFDYTRVRSGLALMLWGFFQKVVIADRVALLVNEVYDNYTQYDGAQLLVATCLFAVQIYCDFAGYSDLARGSAQVMGFNLMENFKRPYFARTIPEFWRRWHISLSTWFKDYLYIPLGGSRCSRLKYYRNLLIVFMVSGLWHGASWTFVVWGLLHGMYQVMGDVTRKARLKVIRGLRVDKLGFLYHGVQIIITFLLVNVAWVFFRAPYIEDALGYLRRLFTHFNLDTLRQGGMMQLGLEVQDVYVMGISIIILFVVGIIQEKCSVREQVFKLPLPLRWAVYLGGLFFILIFGVYGPGYAASQFIYFQF